MKSIGYFTKAEQVTDEESEEIDIIANAISFRLRVLNSESSAQFGSGSVQLDFANGTVPDNFKSLPKFVSANENLIVPGFLTESIQINSNEDLSYPLSKFGLSGKFDVGGSYSNKGIAPYYWISDEVFNIRATVADHYIVILRNRETGGNVGLVFDVI